MIQSVDAKVEPNGKTYRSKETVALMPCGDLFEEFFDSLGVSFEVLRTEQTGGWMFNYIEALQLANVQTILIFISANVSRPRRFTHEPTGATVCILPAPLIYRVFRWMTCGTIFRGNSLISSKESYWVLLLNRALRELRSLICSLDSYFVLPLQRLTRELRRYERCGVVFQDYENPSFDICVLLGKVLRIPVFATFQGGSARSRLEQQIRFLILRGCTGLLIGSENEMRRVQTQYRVPRDRMVRIFNPVDVLTWQPVDRQAGRSALGISRRARVVICHGRISIKHKGLDLLLESWRQICLERPERELCLLVVGSGADAPTLHAQIRSMRMEKVLWIDDYIRDHTRLLQYLSTADIYAMASRYEGFPVAPIEAMACGLPVVATDVSGIPDILEGGDASGGLIVPRGDTTALAVAVGKLLDDEEWAKELGKRARRRAEECFSLEVVGQQMRKFLFASREEVLYG